MIIGLWKYLLIDKYKNENQHRNVTNDYEHYYVSIRYVCCIYGYILIGATIYIHILININGI